MKLLRYLLLSLAVALIAAYTALWIALPDPLQSHVVTRPPLLIEQRGDDLLLWGSWDTAAGYKPYGVNAVEIRCNRHNERCIEAYASILHHSGGEDLEAQVFSYEIAEWTEQAISATALMPDAECVARVLSVDLPNGPASLELLPDGDACEFEISTAKLMGDPL